MNTVWSGSPRESVTSQLLQQIGLSHQAANLIDSRRSLMGIIEGAAILSTLQKTSCKLSTKAMEQIVGSEVSLSKAGKKNISRVICKTPYVAKENSYLNPLKGTCYNPKVINDMRLNAKTGLPDFHGFPKIVDNYAKFGNIETLVGRDGIIRTRLTLHDRYQGKEGYFEWIIEPDRKINHRLFLPIDKRKG